MDPVKYGLINLMKTEDGQSEQENSQTRVGINNNNELSVKVYSVSLTQQEAKKNAKTTKRD